MIVIVSWICHNIKILFVSLQGQNLIIRMRNALFSPFMKRILPFLLFFLGVTVWAQERRPIDPQHPAWLIHIDVWNNADPQKIIDLIPADIKPYVILNLSMSCSYDKDIDMYKKPQDAIQTYKSWASICCANDMWFTCQPASGGHTHIRDNAANFQKALDTHEYFFIHYKNFLGWNYAEQFWGFNEAGDKSSSSDTDRIKLFANLVPMHHKYGGFLTISFCGNIWSHPLNPCGMMKRNSTFLNNCKKYPEAMLFLYKYTTSANWFNNESVTIGPFISGLAKNYGVRYDNCGWNGAVDDDYFKNKYGSNHTYPGAVGIAPVLEQMCLNGACVWDGPELIWTEDFKETNRTTTSTGYTRRNWTTYGNFDNIWVDMFRKVLDGSIHIASREEVIARTKLVMKNDVSASADNTSLKINAYAAPVDLYHGLYLQDNDPFNERTSSESGFGTVAGYGNNNFLYYKKTGRYQTIPIVIDLYDSLAKTIPTANVIKRSVYNNKTGKWKNQTTKVAEFNKQYEEVSKGDMFVARHYNELVCYTPYSYFNKLNTSHAEIPMQYNTCDSLYLDFALFSSALVKEYDDHLYFYLNNYRSDTTTVKKDVITIKGAKVRPTKTYKKRAKANATVAEKWNEETGTYTLTVSHNGPVDLTINCTGEGTERLTDYLSDAALEELPVQPGDSIREVIIEAEDMDYKSVSNVVTDAYNSNYRSLLGHSAMGFVVMGSNTSGSLQCFPVTKAAGTYTVTIKYMYDGSANSKLRTKMNTATNVTTTFEPTNGEWKTVSLEAEMKAGKNTFTLTNAGGKDFKVDQITFTPNDQTVAIESVLAQENEEITVAGIYSTSGMRISALQKGVNIIRLSNGKTRKIMMK